MMFIWRVSWHKGFGGIHTDETPDPFGYRHELGPVDWFSIDGCYYVK